MSRERIYVNMYINSGHHFRVGSLNTSTCWPHTGHPFTRIRIQRIERNVCAPFSLLSSRSGTLKRKCANVVAAAQVAAVARLSQLHPHAARARGCISRTRHEAQTGAALPRRSLRAMDAAAEAGAPSLLPPPRPRGLAKLQDAILSRLHLLWLLWSQCTRQQGTRLLLLVGSVPQSRPQQ